mmetsp:Transcript_16969/g.57378  ORF Transcript_16969/g.57378 Transcript_16969/m.57378 type:complete len:449 (-) Transcript_16969:45-1391(-)
MAAAADEAADADDPPPVPGWVTRMHSLNVRLIEATSADAILSIVAQEPRMNHLNAYTAVRMLQKRKFDVAAGDARWRNVARAVEATKAHFEGRHVATVVQTFAKLKWLDRLPDDCIVDVLPDVVREAPSMTANALATSLWGLASLHEKDVASIRGQQEQLERAVQRTAPQMLAPELKDVVWALSRLGLEVRSATLASLEQATVRLEADMDAQSAAWLVHAFAGLRVAVDPVMRDALEQAAERIRAKRLFTRMEPRNAKNAQWVADKLSLRVREATLASLARAVVAAAETMKPQDVARACWGLAKLEVRLEAPAVAALAAAVDRTTGKLPPRYVKTCIWAYAKLFAPRQGAAPLGAAALQALEQHARSVAPTMTPAEVANTLHGFSYLGIRDFRTLEALELAARRQAPGMSSEDVSRAIAAAQKLEADSRTIATLESAVSRRNRVAQGR